MDIKEKNLRKLSYGLYLIGAMDGERPCGCIVNTVFQVTSENPIIATSINKNNYTWELVQKNGRFSVSILSEKTRKEVEPVKGCLYQYRKNVATASKGAYIATRNEM